MGQVTSSVRIDESLKKQSNSFDIESSSAEITRGEQCKLLWIFVIRLKLMVSLI